MLTTIVAAILVLVDTNVVCTDNKRAQECLATYERVVKQNSSWNAQFINYTEEQCQDVLGVAQGFNPNPYMGEDNKCYIVK